MDRHRADPRYKIEGGAARPTENKEKPVSYTPPVFREPGERLVIAVRSYDELEPARALMSELGAAAIVLAEGAPR